MAEGAVVLLPAWPKLAAGWKRVIRTIFVRQTFSGLSTGGKLSLLRSRRAIRKLRAARSPHLLNG